MGKVVSLSPRGVQAVQAYWRLLGEIERKWEGRFGKAEIEALHNATQRLFELRCERGPCLSDGMVPAPGTVRAGGRPIALGRRDGGVAARVRMRDLVEQTQAFIRDPAGSLPHFPVWDMNRGFGP